jgi:hypothetical protein
MGSTARSPRVCARVTPHRGQGESLVPLYTRESVSLSLPSLTGPSKLTGFSIVLQAVFCLLNLGVFESLVGQLKWSHG